MKRFFEEMGSNRFKERKTPTSLLRFGTDVFGLKWNTPHEEMSDCIRLYETEPLVNSGINHIRQFIIGNEIKIVSRDKKTQEFFTKWLEQRSEWIEREIVNFITTGLVTGNMALDVERDEKGCITKFYNMNDTSRVYKNFDEFGKPLDLKKYVYYEVTPTSGIPNAEWFQYSYLGYRNIGIRRIFGLPIPKENIVVDQLGWGRMSIYGRGLLTAALEDATILRQIKQAYAVIAKFKAIPRKLVQVGDKDDDVTGEELQEIKQAVEDTTKGDNIVINKHIDVKDLSYAGQDMNLQPALDHVWRSVISGLTPAYLIGFALDANRATSAEIKIPFWLRILEYRRTFITILNRHILMSYFKAYPFLSRDASFKFGEMSLDNTDDTTEKMAQAYDRGGITLNEYRKVLNKSVIEGADKFKYEIEAELQERARAKGVTTPDTVAKNKPDSIAPEENPVKAPEQTFAKPSEEKSIYSDVSKNKISSSFKDEEIDENYRKSVDNEIRKTYKNYLDKYDEKRERMTLKKNARFVEKLGKEFEQGMWKSNKELLKFLDNQVKYYLELNTTFSESQKKDYAKYFSKEVLSFVKEFGNTQDYEKRKLLYGRLLKKFNY